MKKLSILCALLLLFSTCHAEETDMAMTVALPNAYESCEWSYVCDNEALFSEPFIEETEDGKFILYFDVLGTGTARMYFNCASVDGISAPAAMGICDVIAREDGTLSVRQVLVDSQASQITVTLSTDGEVWTFEGDPTGTMILTGDEETEEGQIYTLRPDEAGAAELVFECGDLWDPAAGVTDEYIVSVVVEDNLEMALELEDGDGIG